MPYINKSQRPELEKLVDETSAKIKELHNATGNSRGALMNFFISELMRSVWNDPRYADMAEARSALQEAHDEYARRVIAPYEDLKIQQEGDIRNFNTPTYNEKNKY